MKKLTRILSFILVLGVAILTTACDIGGVIGNVTSAKTEAKNTTTENKSVTSTPTTAHTHTYGEWAVVEESTCTEKGSKQRTCACGAKETEELDYADHIYDYANGSFTWVSNGTSGYKAEYGYKCAVCKTQTKSQATVTSTSATATCLVTGDTTYTAKVTLGGTEYTDTKVVTGELGSHTLTKVDAVAGVDCEHKGTVEYYECSVCNKKYTDNTCTVELTSTEGEFGPHSYDYANGSFTFTEDLKNGGYKAAYGYKCTICNGDFNTQATVTNESATATCLVTGDTTYTAKVTLGGTEYTDTKVVTGELGPHNYQNMVWYDHILDGYIESGKKCSVCEDTQKSNVYLNVYDASKHVTGFNSENASYYSVKGAVVTVNTMTSGASQWCRFDFTKNTEASFKYAYLVVKGSENMCIGAKFDTSSPDNNKYDKVNGNKQYKSISNKTEIIIWDLEKLGMDSKLLEKVVFWPYGVEGATSGSFEVLGAGLCNTIAGTTTTYVHNFNSYETSAEGHKHVCACGEKQALVAHTEEEIAKVDPTYDTKGSTAGVKCSVCGYVITAPEEIDKLKYTITFELDGGALEGGITSYDVYKGTPASGLAGFTPTKTGYTFSKWQLKAGETYVDIPANATVTENITIKAIYTPNTNTAYSAKIYAKTELNGQYVDVTTQYSSEVSGLTGTTGETVDVTTKAQNLTPTGFTLNTSASTLTGVVAADGSLVLTLKYDIIAIDVTLTETEGVAYTGTDKVKYNGTYEFTLSAPKANYDISNVVVKVNGNVVEATENKYSVSNVTSALTVTVEGVLKLELNAIERQLIAKNGTAQLTPTVKNGGTYAYTYTSSNEQIATVSTTGLISAVTDKVGEVTITISCGDYSLDVEVIVYSAILNVSGQSADSFKSTIEADMNGYYILTADYSINGNNRFLNPVGIAQASDFAAGNAEAQGATYTAFNGTINGLGHTLTYRYNWGGLVGSDADKYLIYGIGETGVVKNIGLICSDENNVTHRRSALCCVNKGLIYNCYIEYSMQNAGGSVNTTYGKGTVCMFHYGTMQNCIVRLTNAGSNIALAWATYLGPKSKIINGGYFATGNYQSQGSGAQGYTKQYLSESNDAVVFMDRLNTQCNFVSNEFMSITKDAVIFGGKVKIEVSDYTAKIYAKSVIGGEYNDVTSQYTEYLTGLRGLVGSTVDVTTKAQTLTPTGYHLNTTNSVLTGKIASNGALELVLKYDIDCPQITLTETTGVAYTGATEIEYGGTYEFSIAASNINYDLSNVTVKVDGNVVTAVEGKYTVANVTGDITVTVEGVIACEINAIERQLIAKNGTAQLTPTAKAGGPFTFTYTSKNTNIVTVNESGLISAVTDKFGEAVVTISCGTYSYDVEVIVYTTKIDGTDTSADYLKNAIEADMNGYIIFTASYQIGGNHRFLNPIGQTSAGSNGTNPSTNGSYNAFNGTINGLGHTISYLYNYGGTANCNNDKYFIHCIGSTGVVKNFGIIAKDEDTATHRRAALCCINNGLVYNCYIEYTMNGVTNSSPEWGKAVCCIVNNGTIDNCVLNCINKTSNTCALWGCTLSSTSKVVNGGGLKTGSVNHQNSNTGLKQYLNECSTAQDLITGLKANTKFVCGEYWTITDTTISFGGKVVVSTN